jgi:2,3-bisphosphoglycerate-dependent phosphoglycerate mutase
MPRLPTLDLLLVRHAESVPSGTSDHAEDERPLTAAGQAAAIELADELEPYQLNAVYSSPYPRAVQTVRPIAERRGLEIQILGDLRERRLTSGPLATWREHLERAWQEQDYAPPGGETGRDAQRRAMAILDLLRSRHIAGGRIVVASHGNLISLVLQALEPGVDFAFHLAMPNPALYRLNHDGVGWRVMGGHGFRSIADHS